MAYLPGIVIIGFYFKRFQNIIYGLVASSTGVSVMIFAPLVNYLITEYGWRGSMLLMAGIMLHMVAAGAVFLPIDSHVDTDELISPLTNVNILSADVLSSIEHLHAKEERGMKSYMRLPQSYSDGVKDGGTTRRNRTESARYYSERVNKVKTNPRWRTESANYTRNIEEVQIDDELNTRRRSLPVQIRNDSKTTSVDIIRPINTNNNNYKLVNPMIERTKAVHRNNVFSMMSSDLITHSFMSINNLALQNKQQQLSTTASEENLSYFQTVLKQYKPLKTKRFLILCLNLLIANLAFSCTYVSLPAFAIETGSTASEASTIISVMGISNTVARFLVGLSINDNSLNLLLIYLGTCGVSGTVLCIGSFVTATYFEKMVFAFLIGLYGSSFIPLMSPVTISIVGVEHLSTAMGAELLVSAFGFLLGPPIGGNRDSIDC